jgi:stage V sporulation protein B
MALANRIILTRMLGNEGISLYMLCLPSIMLFISVGSLSLNLTMTKMVAVDNNLAVLKKGIKIALISSFIVSLILLLIIKPLSNQWLKQPSTFYPILWTIPLISLSAINSVLRGYYNGIKKVNITSLSILTEQIFRILFSVLLLIKFIDRGVVFAVSIAVLAMSIGEIASIVVVVFKLKKYRPKNNETKNQTRAILDIAIPVTASRLLGNITFFLEPIIFTLALSILHYNNTDILYKYSEVNAYSIPLITMFSFISAAIATAIIPHVATSSKKQVSSYITSSLFYCFLPAIPISLILTSYAYPLMNLIYDTNIGSQNVQTFTFLFILFYLQPPLISIMQSTNHTKKLLTVFTVTDILKLTLIFCLPFVSNNGLIIALLVSSSILTIWLYIYLKKTYKFKFSSQDITNLTLVALVSSVFVIILKVGNVNYLLSSILIIVVFYLTCRVLGLFRFNNK